MIARAARRPAAGGARLLGARPLTGPILALSGVLYTIPSLALFALLAPLLGTTSDTPS